ncbi:MAG: CinA family nicotinamide mononucleotide deamidase-related protein [Verrucomicrobia bacterium]|nr:CinA family nicotinamide mononucleotide deamidase-related protein [Verrucomicrobiota bacterium]
MDSCHPAHPREVLVINVGDELLDGLRGNSHLVWLGEQLARRGLPVTRAVTVRDDASAIAREVGAAWGVYDVIVTTGGIGPTTDDCTREAVAAALGVGLTRTPHSESALRDRFQRIGRTVSDADLRQCRVPVGGAELRNPRGTAPGVWFSSEGRALVMLPGPGLELRPMFDEEVVPRLRDLGCACRGEAYVQVRTYGIGAAPLEALIRPVVPAELTLTFGTHTGIVDARISSGGSGATADDLCCVARLVRDAVGEDFICTGHACLASIVIEQLRSLEKSVSLAESCTGGLLADAFASVPGASKVFAGSAVCYSNDAKMNLLGVPESLIAQHGAVSAEAAAAMAFGTAEKFGSDYALSVTGFAGPDGGTDADPVGTVFLGYSSPTGVWSRRISVVGDRAQVRRRSVNTALDWMRRKLNRYRVEDLLHGS